METETQKAIEELEKEVKCQQSELADLVKWGEFTQAKIVMRTLERLHQFRFVMHGWSAHERKMIRRRENARRTTRTKQ